MRNKLKKLYYHYILRDDTRYAEILGVKMGTKCNILTEPGAAFGSEPWLITLGNHVEITMGVKFITHDGALWCIRTLNNKYCDSDSFSPIKVGDNVFIGFNTIIMPGVTIGNNVIVGANSVVTKSIPDGCIVAGSPAKQISTISEFMEKLSKREITNTKKFTSIEKRDYFMKIHPEWF